MKHLINTLVIAIILMPAVTAHHETLVSIAITNRQEENTLLQRTAQGIANSTANGVFSVNVSYEGFQYALAYDIASKVKGAGYNVTLDRASHTLNVSW